MKSSSQSIVTGWEVHGNLDKVVERIQVFDLVSALVCLSLVATAQVDVQASASALQIHGARERQSRHLCNSDNFTAIRSSKSPAGCHQHHLLDARNAWVPRSMSHCVDPIGYGVRFQAGYVGYRAGRCARCPLFAMTAAVTGPTVGATSLLTKAAVVKSRAKIAPEGSSRSDVRLSCPNLERPSDPASSTVTAQTRPTAGTCH
jgi:hypothetical protein